MTARESPPKLDASDLAEEYLQHALPLVRGPDRGPAAFALALAGFALRYARVLPTRLADWSARLQELPAGRHLYYFGTLQQERALDRIVAVDPDACVIDRAALPRRIGLRLALAALPLAWRAYRNGSAAQRVRLAGGPRNALMAAAWHAAWREILARLQPRCLVVASDTAPGVRAAVNAARAAGIPTVSMQHGCVTPVALPLSTDFALLEGEQALQIYRTVGLGSAQPSLVGVARLGGIRIAERGKGAIGLCGTHLTPVPLLLAAAGLLRDGFPGRRILVRPHPHQFGHWRFRWGLSGFAVSDSRRTTAAQFLEQVDVVVAGSSSILMEAAVLGAAPVYCRALDARAVKAHRNEVAFHAARLDYDDVYGFIAAGLCAVAADLPALPDVIARAELGSAGSHRAAQFYCDTIGGAYEGRSHELALECIRKVARRESLPLRLG